MRYVLILVLLCCSLTLSGTTYYIDPSGNNSNNGSSGSPWQTLAYACSKVTVSGDIIHINAGTYTVSSQISVPVGVSIEGEGMAATTIISTVTGGSTLYLASSSENTNGNQHISGIYFNGNNRTTPLAIMVYARGNISIDNNTFINYDQYGVRFEGGAGGARSTSVKYSTGNSFHDNVVTNCAYYSSGIGGGAALMISCQTGFLCYNNTVTQSRTTYTNGCGIKTGGWTRGFKIYNNTLTGDINSDKGHADSWDFAIEMWGDVGSITEGTEIYGNNIYNWEIDISGRITQKGSYDYGCSIHDNFIGCVNVPAVPKIGIWLEANTSLDYILIYKNHIKNVSKGIGFYATNQTPLPLFYNNISIYYNLIDNCGYNTTGNDQARGIWWSQASGTTNTVNNLKIYNNVITARTAGAQEVGIELDCLAGVTATNFEIKNNIVTGFDDAAIFTGLSGTIDYLAIQNNIFYNNGQSNAPKINITPGHYTNSGNLTSDPLFVSTSDYHLQGTSPAINAGINITALAMTADYYGAAIGSPPEIGACEYGSTGTVPVVPVYVSSAVSNATPSILEMTYNSSLANIVPAASAFSVLVNSTARTVSTVTISGTKVQLSLSSPVISGDVVSVAYSSPSANPLQSSSAGIAASIIAKTVTNGVTATIPVYVSSAIASAAPSLLEMTYNTSLTNIIPATSSFSVLVNSVTRAINTVAISGTKVQLTLASPVVNGDVVTVSYTKPAVNPLQTASAGIAASVSAKTVTNGVSAAIPVYVSSAIASAAPSLLEMTYNTSLTNIIPATSSFSVLVNSVTRAVNTVAISGTKVQLTLASPVVNGDVVTVSYTKPAVNPLQTASAGIAASVSAKTVTNGVSAAIPVYVSSAIASATPSLLEMTYNTSLTNIVPATSSFSVLVNSVTRAVNSVAISGTKVQLTLASPVVNGDVVTVSYTKPAVNPLQTASAGIAASVSAKTVTNGVSAAIPVYVSSAIASAAPSLLEMTYNTSLTNIIPATSSFSVLVNSVTRAVNTVAISGTKVQLTLASPVVNGDVVTVSYTKPAVNPLQTASAGMAASVSAKTVTNGVAAAIPVYVSSAIASATPSLLEMTYNMSLANIIPATSSFSVLVNSVTRAVNSVAISGTKVQLTLASPVVNSNVVTISYTKPSVNPLQTASAGMAASVSAKTVTNGVAATIPVYVASGIASATPSLLEITYNLSLANIVPAASAFSVLVNSVARTVNTIVISGSKVQLTLASPVVNSDVVTVSYTKPAVNPLQTPPAGMAASIGTQTVTVGVIAVVPVYVSSTVANATPSLLEISYNTSLANIVPAPSSFTILVNSVSRTVNLVVVTGTKVQLSMTNPIVPGDVITVSYVQPSTNPLQTITGGKAISVTGKSVINNCINLAPTAVITSPVTTGSFSSPANITITADAFDTDGTVSQVEFYNGTTKLGSSFAAPYSFTWNNVIAGNYTLTVVATDNLNAKTTSSAISISVTVSYHASNRHPFIKISNPRKGISYDNMSSIEIDAIASDPDGTISSVEFYNGTEKLVELTSAPYAYIWKDVVPGSYSITAIATDNLGDTTASEPIEFVVGSRVKYDANSEIINLYPNPSDGHFSIDFVNPILSDKGEIIITDLAGKQVYRGPILREELTKQFDLSDFKSGIYVMIVKDKDILVTKKILKN